ncbi:MAG TPA: MBG domain-containing protein, partial [Candidatus Acidoferrum sp.]|nr:MBG domain-containing protein [Candidatus Acidoferrum sp.]
MQGFVNGEEASALGGTLLISSAADAGSPVGRYDIVASGLTSTNYALSYSNGTLTILQVPLTVSANSYIRQYGTPNPVFDGTMSGLLNGDPITATYSSAATQSSPGGSYAIVPSLNDPEGKAANYAVTLQNGTLTITVAVTPTAATGLYVVGSPAVFMDTNASVADGGGLGFGGGTLTVTVITNASTNDVLGIASQGNGAGQVGVQSTNVNFSGVTIASFSGGNGANPLVFLLNTNASAESVTALARQLTFATTCTNTNFCVIQTALTVGSNTVLAEYVLTLDRPPVAGNFVITAAQGQAIQIPFCQILTNIYDADSNTLTITDCSEVSANGGWVAVNSTAFLYAPPQGSANQDRFACLVEDGLGGNCVGVIVINFMPTNLLHLDLANLSTTGAALTMAGVPGRVYVIQASTNLADWVDVSAVTADSMGIIQLLDSAARNCPQRFYRAKPQ